MSITYAVQKAVGVFVQNPLMVLGSICVDLGALVFFGFLSAPVYDKLTEHGIIIGTLISQKVQSARGKSVLSMLFEFDTLGYVSQLVVLLGLLLFILYVVFVVSQSITLLLAKRAGGEKAMLSVEIRSIALKSVFWSLVLAVLYGIYVLVDIRALVLHKLFPQETGTGIVHVLPFVTGLFVLIAAHHLVGGRKEWFWRQRKMFVMSCALLVAVFFVTNSLLRVLNAVSFELMMFGGIFVVFPLLVVVRLFLREVVKSNGIYS